MLELIDFHSHILPFVDDGAKDNEMAISMIQMSVRQGVEKIIATPHFLPKNMSPAIAIAKRNASLERLKEFAYSVDFRLPEIIPAFEVNVDRELINTDIRRLGIGESNVILLEMPHRKWSENTFKTLEKIRSDGFEIILAHVERYIGAVSDEYFERLMNMGFYNQVNSNAFIIPGLKDLVAAMVKEGFVHLIGSDAHNTSTRCSIMDVASNFIKTRVGEKYYDNILENENKILNMIKKEQTSI